MAKKLKDEARRSNAPEPDHEAIREFVDNVGELMADMAKPRGDIGQAYKEAEKERGLNRAALRTLVRLTKMPDDARADFFRTLDAGRVALSLDRQSDLFEAQGGGTTYRDEGPIDEPQDGPALADAKAKAYAAGAKAGEEGAAALSNPYAVGELNDAWFSGWQAGQAVIAARMAPPEPVEVRTTGRTRKAVAAAAPAFPDA